MPRLGLSVATLFVGLLWAMPDTTAAPLSTPSRPIESHSRVPRDIDEIVTGSYLVSWRDRTLISLRAEVLTYELQERIGTVGSWQTLTLTGSQTSWKIQGRTAGQRYFYRVRVQDRSGSWSQWSASSDGIYVRGPLLSISIAPALWAVGTLQTGEVRAMSQAERLTVTNDGNVNAAWSLALNAPAGWSAA